MPHEHASPRPQRSFGSTMRAAAGTLLCAGWAVACATEGGVADPGTDPAPVYVVFAANGMGGEDDIYIMKADGSERRQLTFTNDEERFPALSPDGNRVAFNRGILSQSTIWTINADGTGETSEADGTVSWPRPRWTFDGSRLVAFNQSGTLGQAEDAIVLYTFGTDAPVPVSDILGNIPTAAYGDARIVAIVNTVDPQDYIAMYDLSQPMPALTALPLDVARVVRRLNWSPDGSRVVFESGSTVDGDLLTRSTTPGGATVVLTDGPENDREPVYSPDGTAIYFIRDGAFFRMNADGTNPVEIVPQAEFGGSHIDVR